MELWFTEEHSDDVRFSIRIVRQLFSKRSHFQQIDIFDSKEFGKVLVLDDSIVITEKDEFIYHEMMVHVACAANPDLKKVLVIGGSNGGCVRELIKYPFIEKIDVVEADEELVKACKVHFPKITKSLEDPRVSVIVSDGLKFVRKLNKVYDLILVDSTDPFGPNETFFTREFYGNCFTALTPSGILVTQQESPFYPQTAAAMVRAVTRMKELFGILKLYQAQIPSYPSGHWLFSFASKDAHPIKDLDKDYWRELRVKTRYYNEEIHSGCFALPNYIKEDILNETN